MNKIKGVLVKNGSVKEYDFEYESYKDFYELLGCRLFDIPKRQIGEDVFDIYCDDEALLKKELPQVSLAYFDRFGNIVDAIYGNVFICKHDSEGETISLTDKEVSEILKNEVILQDVETKKYTTQLE